MICAAIRQDFQQIKMRFSRLTLENKDECLQAIPDAVTFCVKVTLHGCCDFVHILNNRRIENWSTNKLINK